MPESGIYLDHNATTPVLPEVVEAILPWFSRSFGNPSSAHATGRVARDAVEEARGRLARAISAHADEVVFTSGGTESNHLAIVGAVVAGRRHVALSATEHPSVVAAAERSGAPVMELAVGSEGFVPPDALDTVPDGALVSVMHANNETGAVNELSSLATTCRRRGLLLHSDAAQSLGKIPVDVEALGVDLLTLAGHKLYAPKGVGALYVRRGTPLAPIQCGGGQERGLRAGTENVPYVVALGLASEIATRTLGSESERQRHLVARLWGALSASIPGLRRATPARCLPNTLLVLFPRVLGGAVLDGAPEVHASTGSACHAGEHRPSRVLLAMGIGASEALGAVRLSCGRGTTIEQIDRAAAALTASWRALA